MVNITKGDGFMGKGILAAFVTLVVGLLTMAAFTGAEEVGVIVAVAVMGAFIIGINDKKN